MNAEVIGIHQELGEVAYADVRVFITLKEFHKMSEEAKAMGKVKKIAIATLIEEMFVQ